MEQHLGKPAIEPLRWCPIAGTDTGIGPRMRRAPIAELTGGDGFRHLDRFLCGLWHPPQRHKLGRWPLPFNMPAANEKTLVDAGILREGDPLRIMSGDDPLHVETVCQEKSFIETAGASADRHRNDLRQRSVFIIQDLVGQWHEEGPDAVGRDDATRRVVTSAQGVADPEFMGLHLLQHICLMLEAALRVVGERSVHDDAVEALEREVDALAFSDLRRIEAHEVLMR